jgi:hypothetical protein
MAASSTLRSGPNNVSSYSLGSSTGIPTNAWVHIAFVRKSNSARIYVNGVPLAAAVADSNSYSQTALYIGGGVDGYFDGYMSNVRIIKGTAIYDPALSSFTPPTSPLTNITNTVLLTCQNPTIIDNSTNLLTITNTGTATTTNIPSTFYFGKFNGTSSYLSIPYSANLNPSSGTAMTAECWVFLTGATTAYQFIMGMNNLTVSNWVIKNENGTIQVAFGNAGGNLCAATVLLNVWTHIALVLDAAGNFKAFLNGVLTLTGTATTFATNSIPLSIGARTAPDRYFPGYITNARIVKGAALYSASFTPSTTQLTAVPGTSLLTLNSPTVIDNSGSNLTVTNTGVTVSNPIL